jgi:hypothetical protein
MKRFLSVWYVISSAGLKTTAANGTKLLRPSKNKLERFVIVKHVQSGLIYAGRVSGLP